MVQIPKTWNLNPSTNICPSCGNIHSIKIMIYKELMGEETFKTINFRTNFCIQSHILAHNSQEGPWSYLKSHTPEKLLPIRFWWCITLAWVTKFLLSGFLASVPGWGKRIAAGPCSGSSSYPGREAGMWGRVSSVSWEGSVAGCSQRAWWGRQCHGDQTQVDQGRKVGW